jgi:peptide/nickel transport system substrate-binding protein
MEPRQPFNQPEMNIWIQESRDAQGARFVRNPYFWAVDTEGNQLPYIDRLEAVFFSDRQVAILNMMQGKIDIGGRLLNAEEFPLYKENAAKGNYRVLTWQETKMSASGYKFNLTSKDPVKRKVFQDERFRQAMSHAINREEINQFVFLGLGTPQQFTIDSGASFYDPSWNQYVAAYDVAKAKSLLQQVGLRDVDNDGFVDGPDGKPFVIDMLVSTESVVGSIGMKVSELVADYWRKAGVKVNLKQISQELYENRGDANELDVAIFPSEADLETRVQLMFNYDQSGAAFGYAPEWQSWLAHQRWETAGRKSAEPAKGEEPPADEKKFIELYSAYINAVNPAEYAKLAKEFWAMATKRLELIGTVGKVPRPIIISNRIQNVPEKLPFAFETMLWVPPTPWQWYVNEK